MKQKRIDTWKGIRSIGKWRFVISICCIFYCLASIATTLRQLWPDGKFINFGDFLTKVIILFVIGFFVALITWKTNERKFKKVTNIESNSV